MATAHKGKVVGVSGNMVTVDTDGHVFMNEVGYIVVGDKRLKSEVIRIRGSRVELQVFEMTRDIGIDDPVEFSGELLSVQVGPGLLGQIYDGLQNPLPLIAEQHGFFLQRGVYLPPLDAERRWEFTPGVSPGDTVSRGMSLGTVPEGIFKHRILVPFFLYDTYTVKSVVAAGEYSITDKVAELQDSQGNTIPVSMTFDWPVKRPIDAYEERL
ncbi:MAG: V-type ATP synthase subunit A, partial [Spirochaetales bacterium]|nr:V-type ATP synthase subunit A [Spirochaetales bacterium]